MPKRILLIDSDESFVRGLAAAAGANGFLASAATNSEQGVLLAREEHLVSMDDESLGLGDGASNEDEPIQLGEAEAAQAHSANDEAVVEMEELVEMDDAPAPAPERGGGDDDLAMFDQAFDALQPSGGAGSKPVEKPRLRVAPDPEPEPRERRREPTELSAPTDEQLLGLDEESMLGDLDAPAPPLKAPPRPTPVPKA